MHEAQIGFMKLYWACRYNFKNIDADLIYRFAWTAPVAKLSFNALYALWTQTQLQLTEGRHCFDFDEDPSFIYKFSILSLLPVVESLAHNYQHFLAIESSRDRVSFFS